MTTTYREGGIPRLQPRGLPGKPGTSGPGQRFVAERQPTMTKSKGGTGAPTNGPGQRFLADRQPKVGR